MIEFPIPEILRSPLEPLLLQISALSLERDPRDFDFIERPATDAMTHALHRLANLDALDIVTYSHSGISSSSFVREDVNITPLGRVLSLLPVDVVLGKMLLLGSMSGDLVDPTLVMAATLSVSSPFVRVNENDVGVNGVKKRISESFNFL